MEKFTIGFCLLMGMSLLIIFLPAALNRHWLGIVVFSSQVVAGPAQGADYRDPHARAGIRGPRAGAAGGATEREGAPLRRHQLPIRLVIQ